MDVLTIMWGWIGGKKQGAAPAPSPVTPAHVVVSDLQLFSPEIDDDLLYEISIVDASLYGIVVSDE